MAKPGTLRIPYEDFDGGRFNFVGRNVDGSQFMAFVTGAFPGKDRFPDPRRDWAAIKSWNAVVHRFEASGAHVRTHVKRGGFEIEGHEIVVARAWRHLESMLTELGIQKARLCDINVGLFAAEIDGVIYALEYVRGFDEHVMLWPNDIMFHPPWDSGEYST